MHPYGSDGGVQAPNLQHRLPGLQATSTTLRSAIIQPILAKGHETFSKVNGEWKLQKHKSEALR